MYPLRPNTFSNNWIRGIGKNVQGGKVSKILLQGKGGPDPEGHLPKDTHFQERLYCAISVIRNVKETIIAGPTKTVNCPFNQLR